MYRYIFLFLLALSSCQNKPYNELNEFTVEIKNDSIYYHQNDSVFDKLVYVKNNFNLLGDSNNLYMVHLYFQGTDSLIGFGRGFSKKVNLTRLDITGHLTPLLT